MSRPEYALLAELWPTPAGRVETYIPIVDEADATGEIAAAYQYFRDRPAGCPWNSEML